MGKADDFMQWWNEETADVLPVCRVMNAPRQRLVRLALREGDEHAWRLAMRALIQSDWHTGKNERGWLASIDFLLRPGQRAIWLERGLERERERKHYEEKLKAKREEQLKLADDIAAAKSVKTRDPQPCPHCGTMNNMPDAVCFRCYLMHKRKEPRST